MSDENEPKLIIDEDGKTQVQHEVAEASQAADGPGLPPASFPMLIASLGTQAMAALGQLPTDEGRPPEVNFDFARHFIDLIGVLEVKTQGNLTAEENRYLQDTLYQLRLAFVEVKSHRS